MTQKLLSDEELCEKLEDISEYLGCNDMELKNEIIPLINTQKRLYAESTEEELVDFARDVLGQFGYDGKSGGLSTLESAESIIKRYSKAESED